MRPLLFTLASLALLGCKHPAPADDPVSTSPPPPPAADASEPPAVDPPDDTKPSDDGPRGAWGDPYMVIAPPTLEGMWLVLEVQYGGGCADHTFTLSPGPRTSAAPTTQPLTVVHDANGDRCRAIKRSQVKLTLEEGLGADCTEHVLVITPDDTKGTRLPLSPAQGCD